MKITQMRSNKGGGGYVPNQLIIRHEGFEWFQSYASVIARRDLKTGEITLDEDSWDYSATTGVYRNQFLGEGIAETRKKIKAGIYKLAKLSLP